LRSRIDPEAARRGHRLSRRMSYEARLAELKITLPPAPKPVATYVPAVRAGDLLFLSGTGPFKDGVIAFAGKLGKDLTVEQGYEAARLTLLNSLAMVRQALGTLDRVTRVVRLTVHVAPAEGRSSNGLSADRTRSWRQTPLTCRFPLP